MNIEFYINYSAGYRISGKTDRPDIRPIQYPVQPYKIYCKSVLHLLEYIFEVYNQVDAVQICCKFWDTAELFDWCTVQNSIYINIIAFITLVKLGQDFFLGHEV